MAKSHPVPDGVSDGAIFTKQFPFEQSLLLSYLKTLATIIIYPFVLIFRLLLTFLMLIVLSIPMIIRRVAQSKATEIEKMSVIDQQFLHPVVKGEFNALAMNVCVLTSHRAISPREMQTVLIEEVISQRKTRPGALRFTMKVVPCGAGIWKFEVDKRFKLEAHISTIETDSSKLSHVIRKILETPLPLDRPLWKCYMVQGYTRANVVIFAFHKCMNDGYGLLRLLFKATDGNAHKASLLWLRPRFGHAALNKYRDLKSFFLLPSWELGELFWREKKVGFVKEAAILTLIFPGFQSLPAAQVQSRAQIPDRLSQLDRYQRLAKKL